VRGSGCPGAHREPFGPVSAVRDRPRMVSVSASRPLRDLAARGEPVSASRRGSW